MTRPVVTPYRVFLSVSALALHLECSDQALLARYLRWTGHAYELLPPEEWPDPSGDHYAYVPRRTGDAPLPPPEHRKRGPRRVYDD